jgi:hypothetical protein
MDQLIGLLIAVLVFCCIAYGLWWICQRFFPEFPPARWICGVILLIMLLAFFGHVSGGGSIWPLRWK